MNARFVVVLFACSFFSCAREREPAAHPVPPEGGRLLQVRVTGIDAGGVTPLPHHRNPYEGNVHALDDGARLYTWFNCAGCHGAVGGGGMGPPLADEHWIYGSTPAHIYRSIIEGRPEGMPSFRGVLTEDDTWKLAAYVRSLSPASREAPLGSVSPEISRQQQEKREGAEDGQHGGASHGEH